MVALAYAGGVAAHVLSKALGWSAGAKRRPLQYWSEFWPLVIQGLLIDAVLFGAWAGGVIDLGVSPSLQTAALAGWVADSVGKTVMQSYNQRRNGKA
jgi:hypothetical protein